MQFVPGLQDAIAMESEGEYDITMSLNDDLIFNNIICEAQGNRLLEWKNRKIQSCVFCINGILQWNLQVKVYILVTRFVLTDG